MKQLTLADWTGDLTIPAGRGLRAPLVLDEGWVRGLLAEVPADALGGVLAGLSALRGEREGWDGLDDDERVSVRSAMMALVEASVDHPMGRRPEWIVRALTTRPGMMTRAEADEAARRSIAAADERARVAAMTSRGRDIELYAENERRRFKNRPGGSGRR